MTWFWSPDTRLTACYQGPTPFHKSFLSHLLNLNLRDIYNLNFTVNGDHVGQVIRHVNASPSASITLLLHPIDSGIMSKWHEVYYCNHSSSHGISAVEVNWSWITHSHFAHEWLLWARKQTIHESNPGLPQMTFTLKFSLRLRQSES